MPSPQTPARERVLDAYVSLLIDAGERAATLDAVARTAGVSKGGLLYHFPNKDALVAGLIERLDEGVAEDVAAFDADDVDPIDYFIRTSVNENTPYDRAIVATLRIATENEAARNAILRMRQTWRDALSRELDDPALIDVVLYVSDGMHANSSLDAQVAMSAQDIIRTIRKLSPAH
ncbi:TetR/AcrR family transcriptional regulator [Leucobacter sp. M11]|uniref:TetR/AcrR family transcriptional regulator n=1 Tax=Leucobacter sp. M11 TaxID=2993565 RepID=UPI002D7EDB25|nr:helix-turn-helix domain-containing protein [Leucobacter sp. M11]MEB4613522.1 helix-turn-helix domain containing protein [Leucobacter sp. M11]